MIIKIDNRERKLITLMNALKKDLGYNFDIVVEVLDLGDIIICDDNVEKLIIERKSLSDLAASLKDGRYSEQSFRLNGMKIHNHNIVYLIEGDIHNYNNKLLWINTNVLNVNNPKHVEWCKHVFIDSAPNILGIYIDNPNPENVFVSRQIEIFKIMFKHDPKHIYFKFDVDNNIHKFCKQKNLSITNIAFRYTI